MNVHPRNAKCFCACTSSLVKLDKKESFILQHVDCFTRTRKISKRMPRYHLISTVELIAPLAKAPLANRVAETGLHVKISSEKRIKVWLRVVTGWWHHWERGREVSRVLFWQLWGHILEIRVLEEKKSVRPKEDTRTDVRLIPCIHSAHPV